MSFRANASLPRRENSQNLENRLLPEASNWGRTNTLQDHITRSKQRVSVSGKITLAEGHRDRDREWREFGPRESRGGGGSGKQNVSNWPPAETPESRPKCVSPCKKGVKHEKRPATVQSTIADLLIYPAVKQV